MTKSLKSATPSEIKLVAVALVTAERGNQIQDGDPLVEVSVEYEVYDEADFAAFKDAWPKHCRCAACGHLLKYACLVKYLPDNSLQLIGRDCFCSIAKLQASHFADVSVALAKKCVRNENYTKVLIEHGDVLAWCEEDAERNPNGKGASAIESAKKFGSWTEPQAAFFTKLAAQDRERRANATATVVAGKQTIRGTVLSLKPYTFEKAGWRCTYNIRGWKLLVDAGGGVKLYGNLLAKWTVAGALIDERNPNEPTIKAGDVVEFSASVEAGKDPLFGFFKRPVVSPTAEEKAAAEAAKAQDKAVKKALKAEIATLKAARSSLKSAQSAYQSLQPYHLPADAPTDQAERSKLVTARLAEQGVLKSELDASAKAAQVASQNYDIAYDAKMNELFPKAPAAADAQVSVAA